MDRGIDGNRFMSELWPCATPKEILGPPRTPYRRWHSRIQINQIFNIDIAPIRKPVLILILLNYQQNVSPILHSVAYYTLTGDIKIYFIFFLVFLEFKTALFNPREKFMKFLQIWPKPELHGQWQKNPDTFVLSLSGRTDFFHPFKLWIVISLYKL